MSGDFFPYHPLRLRLWLLGAGLVALGLAIWAIVGFAESQSPREILRAGLSFGLAAAMGVAFFRFRPRDEWGVRVTPLAVLVSRPRAGLIEVPWSAVKEVRRLGEKRDTLALWLREEQRVLVPAHLFAKRAHFEALAKAIEDRMPAPRYDA
jgi:hypothetical protein